MSDFFSLLTTLVLCGTVFAVVMLVLLALPKSRLRSVGVECMKYIMAAGLFLLIGSPLDAIPDFIPVAGWADDVGYLVAAIAAIRSALGDRKQRVFEQACENEALAREAGLKTNADDPSEGGIWTLRGASNERS